MALHITPAMLVACYEFLRTTPPFDGWELPDSDEIEFRVIVAPEYGFYECVSGQHIIAVSTKRNGHVQTLIETMAHEMCHLRQQVRGFRDVHGASFNAMRRKVCGTLGFDPKAF